MESKHRTIRSLIANLTSSVSDQTRSDSLRRLRLLSKQDADTRPLIAESSAAIPILVDTLFSSSHSAQDNAAATLLNLSITNRHSLMSTRGLLHAISHLLSHHSTTSSPSAVQSSAATLHSLLLVDHYRPIIGSKRDIVHALVDILKNHNSPTRSLKDALKALFGISLYPLNRALMVHLDAVPALFGLVAKERRVGIVEDATAVIAQVAGCEESEEAFRKVSGVRVLVGLFGFGSGSSMRTKENCVSGLLNLVMCGGEKVALEVRKSAVEAMDGIVEVQENGSDKGKSKAVALLKVLLDGGEGRSNNNVYRDSRSDSSLNQAS